MPFSVLPDLEDIPRLRRVLGLTQTKLASLAGVSQSAIVKIEKGQMNPSYAVVKRIFDALEAEREKRTPRVAVASVRSPKVRTVDAGATVETAARAMKRHQFSQMPVFREGRNVGSISEATINDLILAGKDPRSFARIRVADVMDRPFPQIDLHAPVELAASLLRHYDAVLVTDRAGRLDGILTKSDLMKLL
jgi:predicted transcriptional regulator